MYQCLFCNCDAAAGETVAREMMFGLRDEFAYLECGGCGSLQIGTLPADLQPFYPQIYSSFVAEYSSAVKRWLRWQQFSAAWGNWSPVGSLLVKLRGTGWLVLWLKPAGVKLDNAILDVGSGSGKLQMRDVGFRNLTRIDPFLDRNINYPGNACILRRELDEVDQ